MESNREATLYKPKDYPEKIFERFYRQRVYLNLQRKVKNIVIYKGGDGLGDLIVSIPLFRAFRQAFPKAKIFWRQ